MSTRPSLIMCVPARGRVFVIPDEWTTSRSGLEAQPQEHNHALVIDAFLGLRLLDAGLCVTITNVDRVRTRHESTGNRFDLPDVLFADNAHPTEFPLDEPN